VSGIHALADARQSNGYGVDVVTYCNAMGKGNPVHAADGSPNAAYSWGCSPDLMIGKNWDTVCYNVWGYDYHAVLYGGANNLGGWHCEKGGGNQNPQPQAPSTSQGSGNSSSNPNASVCSATGNTNIHVGMRVVVPNDGGGNTSLRDAPHSPRVIESMPEGEESTVIGGPLKCLNNTIWWKLSTDSGNTGWVVESYDGSIGIAPAEDQPKPKPAPTQTPAPKQNPPVQPQAQSDPTPCVTEGYLPNDNGITLVSYNPHGKPGLSIECVQAVRDYFIQKYGSPRLPCVGGTADAPAKDWAQQARSCGYSVNPQGDNSWGADPAQIQYEDVAVWNARCGVAAAQGHVGVVLDASQASQGILKVWDANVPPNNPPGVHTPPNIDFSCMAFIHTKNGQFVKTGGSLGGASSSQRVGSSAVNIDCLSCRTQDSVDFLLPTGQYDQNSLKIYLLVNGSPVDLTPYSVPVPSSAGNGQDKWRFLINGDFLSGLAQTSKISLSDIQNRANWYLTYSSSR
jgi:hypothetical protein